MQHQLDYVLRTVEERGVRFVRLWFTDVLGVLKSVAVAPAELEGAFEEGIDRYAPVRGGLDCYLGDGCAVVVTDHDLELP